MEIYISLSFDAAHRLPNVPAEHKCGRLHGHTFLVEVHVTGDVDDSAGWVVDFGDVKQVVKRHIDQLDHTYLNEIEGLENPTSECIAKWIWGRVKSELPGLARIVVKESPHSGAVYTGVPQ